MLITGSRLGLGVISPTTKPLINACIWLLFVLTLLGLGGWVINVVAANIKHVRN